MFRERLVALGLAMGVASSSAFAADFAVPLTDAYAFTPRFYLHVGPAGLVYDEGATMTAGGAPLAGATVAMKWNPTVAAEIGYFFTPNIAVSFTGGMPVVAKVHAAGAINGMGLLGETLYGPMALTVHYHFTGFGRVQPYVGLGPVFSLVFDETDRLLSQVAVRSSFGFALQAGADIMINDRWGMFFDVKKVWLSTIATGLLGGIPVRANVRLDPLVLHTGITYRF
jgi:outer membrane protein